MSHSLSGQRAFLCGALLLALVSGACGGDSGGDAAGGGGGGEGGPSTPVSPPSGGGSTPVQPVQVTGSERLAWDQPETSSARIQQYTFIAYVDGVRAVLPDARCGTTASGGQFPCSARLPALTNGTHIVEVAGIFGGREGGTSSPVVVRLGSGNLTTTAAVASVAATSTDTCAASGPCFSVTTLGALEGAVTAMAASSDDRLWLVEDATTVKVMVNGAVQEQPAFAVDPRTRHISDLAVDPAFAESSALYVAWVDDIDPSRRSVSVSRLRVAGPALGQEAVVVSALPLPPAGEPRLTVDTQGRIYVSLPGGQVAGTGTSESVVRFNPDGSVPWESGQTQPYFDTGVFSPLALQFDAQSSKVWAAGRDRFDSAHVIGHDVTNPMTRGVSASFVDAVAAVPLGPALLLVSSEGTVRLAGSGSDSGGATDLPLANWVVMRAVPGARGDAYLTARQQQLRATAILRLTPAAPTR